MYSCKLTNDHVSSETRLVNTGKNLNFKHTVWFLEATCTVCFTFYGDGVCVNFEIISV